MINVQCDLSPRHTTPHGTHSRVQIPLEFVGQQGFRWGGGPKNGGKELFYNGTYVSTGTVPAGSKWSKCTTHHALLDYHRSPLLKWRHTLG